MKLKVAIASDHAGVELKSHLIQTLTDVDWVDLGPNTSERVDYPDFAKKVAQAVSQGGTPFGVLICGSGIGMSIAANKIKGIRAALIENPLSARLSREHNDANIICLGERLIGKDMALECVNVFLKTPFQNGRHADRVQKISTLENP